MNTEDATEIINKICDKSVRGALVIRLKDNEFDCFEFGEVGYLEQIGLLEQMKFNLLYDSEQYNDYIAELLD